METYLKNGTVVDKQYILEDDDNFCIQKLNDGYIYPGDSINYELDNELVALYDTFRDLFFSDTDAYYAELCTLPIFVQDAGQSSDCALKKDFFMKLLKEYAEKHPNIYKYLYLVDCQYLIGTIQNLLSGMEYSFINFYTKLSNTKNTSEFNDEPTTVIMEISNNATEITTLIESYFVKAYSILDMVCKIAYELEFVMNDFSAYKKLKSSELLWGDKKKLKINSTPHTIFEKCKLITMIESLRNEIVHNGSWELRPRIFTSYKENKIIERFIFFPDITEKGHLETAKNRRHFFGDGLKVNEILPKIHNEFLHRLLNTIALLNNHCNCCDDKNE